MKNHRTRFLITLLVIIILAAVGYYWYQQSQNEPGREIVNYVDRGLDEEHKAQLLEEIEEQKQAIAEDEASGEEDISKILQLGNSYYRLGELKTSVEYYDQILESHPDDAPALENKGQSLYEMGDFEGAEEAWLKALESSQYEVTYIRLAKLYNEDLTEKQSEIRPLIETAVTNLGQQEAFMIILGHWYRDNGLLDEAISHYEIVMKLNPGNKDIAKEIQKLREQMTRELQLKVNE